jgi:hypothetical protein
MLPRLLFADWRVPLLAVTSHFSVLGTRINEILDVSTSKGKGKGHPCTGTEALYRPYGPWGEYRYSSTLS